MVDNPFEVTTQSGLEKTDVIYLNALTPAMRELRVKMVGIVFDAMLSAQKKFEGFSGKQSDRDGHTDTHDSLDLDSGTLVTMLYAANQGQAMIDMYRVFDKLMISPGIAFCHESRVPMTKNLWSKIDDADYVIGEYLANFIAPALDTMITKKL